MLYVSLHALDSKFNRSNERRTSERKQKNKLFQRDMSTIHNNNKTCMKKNEAKPPRLLYEEHGFKSNEYSRELKYARHITRAHDVKENKMIPKEHCIDEKQLKNI